MSLFRRIVTVVVAMCALSGTALAALPAFEPGVAAVSRSAMTSVRAARVRGGDWDLSGVPVVPPAGLASVKAAGIRGGDWRIPGEPRTSFISVHSCWSRDPHPVADALGMPARFCISSLGVETPKPHLLPFVEGSAMLVEGDPVAGRRHISGGARETWGWTIVGDLGSFRLAEEQCGRINAAVAAVYMGVDGDGVALQDRPVKLYAVMYDGSSLCRTPASSVEVPYTLER